jgi:transketolase
MKDEGTFSKNNYKGRNLHFGIREGAMAAIGNGLALHGGIRPYVSTFLVFSDYLKPMARLSALMSLPVTYVLTHDSIGVGEDGPTHEPVEHMTMFRAMPRIMTFRPADARETAAAWYYAATVKDHPTVLALSRQNLPQISGTGKGALHGGYVVKACSGMPQAILMASGSELQLAVRAAEILEEEGIQVQVVSMICMELFDSQPEEYKESVLPKTVRARVAIEAQTGLEWGRYTGLDGACISMNSFGASGKAEVLFEHFGFTVDHVVETTRRICG